jgi:hypothetical protein
MHPNRRPYASTIVFGAKYAENLANVRSGIVNAARHALASNRMNLLTKNA